MKTRKIIFILNSAVLIGIAVWMFTNIQSKPSVTVEKECLLEMRWLWDGGRSYNLANGLPFDHKLAATNLSPYFHLQFDGRCPADNRLYLDFAVLDGPRCPNGHDFTADDRRYKQKYYRLISYGLWRPSDGTPPPVPKLLEALATPKHHRLAGRSLIYVSRRLQSFDTNVLAALRKIVQENGHTDYRAQEALEQFEKKRDN